MKKQLVLPAYIIVEVIYYFTYRMALAEEAQGAESFKTYLPFVSIYFVLLLVNTYLLYVLLPGYLKRSMKRKNIGLKILFYIPLVFIGGLVTNAPVEYLIEGSL